MSAFRSIVMGGLPHQYLFRALEEVKEELLQVSERSSAVGYEENEADVTAVCDLAEDFGDAIMHYQVSHIPWSHSGPAVETTSSSLNRKRYMSRTVD